MFYAYMNLKLSPFFSFEKKKKAKEETIAFSEYKGKNNAFFPLKRRKEAKKTNVLGLYESKIIPFSSLKRRKEAKEETNVLGNLNKKLYP